MTITPDQIPDEAVEAAARTAVIEDGYDETWWDECVARFGSNWAVLERERVRAAASIRAAIKAWPGMVPIRHDQPIGEWMPAVPGIILPLSQEARDD